MFCQAEAVTEISQPTVETRGVTDHKSHKSNHFLDQLTPYKMLKFFTMQYLSFKKLGAGLN